MQSWAKPSEVTPPNRFHVTPAKSVSRIMSDHLIPKIGPRSSLVNETRPGIYLFTSLPSLLDGLHNWLGDYFNEDEKIALLGLHAEKKLTNDAEEICYDPIPAHYLSLLHHDLFNDAHLEDTLLRKLAREP